MTPDEFRRHGREAIDWIADYMERVEQCPSSRRSSRAKSAAACPTTAAAGRAVRRDPRDVDELILPGITHWQSPNFFAYFPGNNSGPSMLGELLSAGLGVQGMLWATSPACTELETLVLDWLVGAGLPDRSVHGRRRRRDPGHRLLRRPVRDPGARERDTANRPRRRSTGREWSPTPRRRPIRRSRRCPHRRAG